MNDASHLTDFGAPREDAVQRGHELDAVNRRTIIVSVGGLIVVMAAALLLVHEVSVTFRDKDAVAAAQAEPGRPIPIEEYTPDQPAQLHALHQSETERLTTYEWTDQKAGVAQIPIERAIDLLAERGLPSTPPPSEQPADSQTDTNPKAD